MFVDYLEDEDTDEKGAGKKFSQYHGTCRHTMDEFTTLKN